MPGRLVTLLAAICVLGFAIGCGGDDGDGQRGAGGSGGSSSDHLGGKAVCTNSPVCSGRKVEFCSAKGQEACWYQMDDLRFDCDDCGVGGLGECLNQVIDECHP